MRTANEISSAYNFTLSGSEIGLVCYYRFDEGEGDVIYSPVGENGHLGDVNGEDSRDPERVESTAPITY